MPHQKPAFFPAEPDPALLDAFAFGRRTCLAGVEALAALSLLVWTIPALGRFPAIFRVVMDPWQSCCALLCALGFQCTGPSRPRSVRRMGFVFSSIATLFALANVLNCALHVASGSSALGWVCDAMPAPIAGGFVLLGIAMLSMNREGRGAAWVGDLDLLALCYLVLVFVSGDVFRALAAHQARPDSRTSMLALVCLALLTFVSILQHTHTRLFGIFLGGGIGGSIARITSPILLILPFLRETARIELIASGHVPPVWVTAIVTSFAAMLYFVLLVYITWRITRMEREIHDLSLRDGLTGLYNLRGFNLLAQQSLRLAQRTEVPFSVLFIDLDNLKQINDNFGHNAGSATLAETADLLLQTFRETDIVGRIGGDEFAVAGQFSHAAISTAIHRLRESAAYRNAEAGRQCQINFSIGQYTSAPGTAESLIEMLNRADNAMYEEKRLKKLSRA